MKIKDPVFIIGCPRSGTTLLYTILKSSKDFYASHSEAHFVWENYVPDKRDPMFAVHLTKEDVKEGDREELEKRYSERVYKNDKFATFTQYLFYNRFRALMSPIYYLWRKTLSFCRSLSAEEYRILDKTPPNTYRAGFLAEVFPDAKFIYLTRDGVTNISSLIEGWRSNTRFNFKFREFYPENKDINIAGYDGNVWKFTHPPGWKDYLNSSLEEVCAFQWLSAHQCAQEAFEKIDASRIKQVRYEDLIANPRQEIQNICDFIGTPYEAALRSHSESLPVVSTNTKPDPKKWLKNKDLIANIAAKIEDMQVKLKYQTDDSVKPKLASETA